MISLLMAATIAANPCMVPHHHKAGHHEPAPLQSCVLPPPLPPCAAPDEPIEPISLPPLRYYLIVESAVPEPIAAPPSADAWAIVTGFIGGGDNGPIPHHGGGGSWHRAPEVSAAGAPAALMLLLLGLIIWKDKP